MAATQESTGSSSEKDEKPLALRKTPRLVVGQSLYRGTASQFQTQAITKMKDNVEASSPATKRVTQSSESKAESPTDSNRNKRRASDQTNASGGKRKKAAVKEMERKHDSYCWTCHKEGILVGCEVCPRGYHVKCAGLDKEPDRDWVCAECDAVLKAENVDMRSNAMRALSVDQLCNLLKFAVSRMRLQCPDEFLKPVPLDVFPNYASFVVHPMDLEMLDKNIKQRMYGCTESFIADTKWILHNCIIFNGYQHKLTSMAKALLKICKHEMSEIEVCPDCYSNAYTKRENWFQEPCCPPHLLIWAKLKGFPFWPAKAMSIVMGNVDVRFFGAHDRAWIPASQCFLLSQEVPTSMKVKKKSVFEQSMDELMQHIKKVEERFRVFHYAAFRAPLVAQDLNIHIQSMLPGVNLKDYCRSSVGTFRYQGSGRQSSSFEGSPFLPKDRHSTGHALQSRSIKQESLSPIVALTKAIERPASEEARTDHSRMIKPRLECMKKLEVAIEKIKSFGKEYESSLGRRSQPSEASTSKLTTEQLVGPVPVQEEEEEEEEDEVGKEKEQEISALEETDSSGTMAKTEDELKPANPTDACEVSSTTCVPESSATFVDECVATSPTVLASVSELPQTFSDVKMNDGVDAVCQENIVPIVNDAVVAEDAAATSVVEPDVAPKLDGAPGESTGPDLTPEGTGNEDDQQKGSSELQADEAMDTGEGNASAAGLSDEVFSGGHDEKMEVEQLEESPVDDKLELSPDYSRRLPDDDLKDKAAESKVSVGEKDAEFRAGLEDSGKEPSAVVPVDEGDLVIDLDRDKEEDALQNAPKAKKRNSRSPFGGIKLKEKTPPKDRKHSTASSAVKAKGKASAPSDKLPVDLGSSPSVPVGNANRINANLPVLSPLGMRNSVSVLQAQQASRSMPTLQPRPSLSAASLVSAGSGACHQSPSSSTGLNKYSQKMVDFVRGTMEEMFQDLAKTGNAEATIKTLQLEMEKMQWHHQQEMSEIKHNTDLILLEMRNSMEVEKQRIVTEVRRQCEVERQKSVEETKKKQWCAYCSKEAIFYCCWNTSYCDYPCQQAHWPRHVNLCSQTQAGGEQDPKDHVADNGGAGARPQSRKQGAKNSKKSEHASEQQHQQVLMGHPQMQGSGPMASALTSVQVIPQGGVRGGPSLQVQYIGSSPQTSVLPTITMQAPAMTAQFATVTSPPGYPVQQGMSVGGPQGAMFQQRPMQGSNLLFPVVSTHQARPMLHPPGHLQQNAQILVSHGMRSQPSLSFIRGAHHSHRGRPYMM